MSELNVPESQRSVWPVAAAIAINLVPIVGVVFWGWSAFALIFLYWLENVVIGVRTLLSMAAHGLLGGGHWGAALFYCGFFTVHYGMFCFGHGAFVVGMFGRDVLGTSMFDLDGAMRIIFTQHPNLILGFVSICLWQVIQFVIFIAGGAVRRTNLQELMGAPYGRIIILHLAIIFGGFLLISLDEPVAGLVMLALLKTAFDVAEALGKAPKFIRARPSPAPPQ